MTKWVPVQGLAPWIPMPPYLVPQEKTDELRTRLQDAGFLVADLNGTVIGSQRELMKEIGRALDLPGFQGNSWDALNDHLRDLPYEGRPRVALIWHNSDLLLNRDTHDFVRSVHLLVDIASSSSALPPGKREPEGQLEVFFAGTWLTSP